MVRKKKSSNKNFFVNFWNGDVSLPMSYWGVGIGIGILYGFIIGIFIFSVGMSEDAIWWAVLVTLQLPLQCQCSTLLLS